MPKEIRYKRITLKARKRINRRIAEQKSRCKGIRQPKGSQAIIANSFFALTLSPKPGAEVFFNTTHKLESSAESICKDLNACLITARRILHGEVTKFNPQDQLSIGSSVAYIIRMFEENILPEGFEYNIEYDDYNQEHYFTIYQELAYPEGWDTLELKHILKQLKRTNKKLHDLFIIFIHSFTSSCNISTWYDTDSWADEWMESQIESLKYESDDWTTDEELIDLLKVKEEYKTGKAGQYKKLIMDSPFYSADQIRAEIKKFRKQHPVVSIMLQGCELMESPYCVNHFNYNQHGDDYYDAGLRFYQQQIILWDVSDSLTYYHQERIDCEAQEGVFSPVISLEIRKDSKEIDIEWAKKSFDWPMKLSEFFNQANKILSKYE